MSWWLMIHSSSSTDMIVWHIDSMNRFSPCATTATITTATTTITTAVNTAMTTATITPVTTSMTTPTTTPMAITSTPTTTPMTSLITVWFTHRWQSHSDNSGRQVVSGQRSRQSQMTRGKHPTTGWTGQSGWNDSNATKWHQVWNTNQMLLYGMGDCADDILSTHSVTWIDLVWKFSSQFTYLDAIAILTSYASWLDLWGWQIWVSKHFDAKKCKKASKCWSLFTFSSIKTPVDSSWHAL